MALAPPPLLVKAEDVPRASAAVFTVSYAIAGLTALLRGILASGGPGRVVGVLPIAAAALAVTAVGATVRRPVLRPAPGDTVGRPPGEELARCSETSHAAGPA